MNQGQQWPFVVIQVHNVKRFWVLNPTSMAYSFAWEALEMASPSSPPSPFQCSTMTGVLAPGKRYEMVFQYTPNEDKLQVCISMSHLPQANMQVADQSVCNSHPLAGVSHC